MKDFAASPQVMDDLHEPLTDLGRRWAASPHRPRPRAQALMAWDDLLARWIASDLPLIARDSCNRGARLVSASGRTIVFSDNSPANWVFGLALLGQVPDLEGWTAEILGDHVPLTFLTKGPAAKRDLNRIGWKICHIDPVSDGRRYRREDAPIAWVEAEFLRLMSPRNMFLVPKPISGAGELPEVIAAVRAFEAQAGSIDPDQRDPAQIRKSSFLTG